jgi:hypothetical protein
MGMDVPTSCPNPRPNQVIFGVIEVAKASPEACFASRLSRWLTILDPTSDLLHSSGQFHLIHLGDAIKGTQSSADKDVIAGVRAEGVDGLLQPLGDGLHPVVFMLGAGEVALAGCGELFGIEVCGFTVSVRENCGFPDAVAISSDAIYVDTLPSLE